MRWISDVRWVSWMTVWALTLVVGLSFAINKEAQAKGKLHGVVVVVTEFGGDLNDPVIGGGQKVDLTGARAEIEAALESFRIHASLDKGTILYLATPESENYGRPDKGKLEYALRVFNGYHDNDKVIVTSDDVFVFYFMGHGFKSAANDRYPTLVLHKGGTDTNSDKTHMKLDKVLDKLEGVKAKYKLVFVDACRVDNLKKNSKNFSPPTSPSDNYHGVKTAIFYAARDGAKAYVHPIKKMGYFTWALSRALKTADADGYGDGSRERDNKVSLEDVSDYVRRHVELATLEDPVIAEDEVQKPKAYYDRDDDNFELFQSVKADARAPFFFWHVMAPKIPAVEGVPALDDKRKELKKLHENLETQLAAKFASAFHVRAYHKPIKDVGWPKGQVGRSEKAVGTIFNDPAYLKHWKPLPSYLNEVLDEFHDLAESTFGSAYQSRGKIFAIFRPRKLAEDDWDMQVAFVRPVRPGAGTEVYVDNLRYLIPHKLNGRLPDAQTWARDIALRIVEELAPELDAQKVLAACFQFQSLKQSDIERVWQSESVGPETQLRYLAWREIPTELESYINSPAFRAMDHSVESIESDIVNNYCSNLTSDDISRHKLLVLKGDPKFPENTVKLGEMNHVLKAYIHLSNITEDIKKLSVVAEPARGAAYLGAPFKVEFEIEAGVNDRAISSSLLSKKIAEEIGKKILQNWPEISRLRKGE